MANIKEREQEQAYLILGEDAADTISELVLAEEINGYVLGAPVVHDIHDRYYDTPDDDLRMSTVSLRIREQDSEVFVTFKGKEKPDNKFTQDHSEWEFPWTLDVAPEDVFGIAGLEPVQERKTTRVTREIMDTQTEKIVGYLSLDSSLFYLSSGEVRIFELEIERKSGKLKNLTKSVEEMLGTKLIRWPHGKFSTGKAFEAALGIKVDENAMLKIESLPYLTMMFDQLVIK